MLFSKIQKEFDELKKVRLEHLENSKATLVAIEENTDTGVAQAAQIAESVGSLVDETRALGKKIDHFVDLHAKMIGYLGEYFKLEIEFSRKNMEEAKKKPTEHDAIF